MRNLILIYIIICGIFSQICLAQINDCEQNLPDLIPYRKGTKWGFCDKNKKIIIPLVYDTVEFFGFNYFKGYEPSEIYANYALVRQNGKSFFIDKNNKANKKLEIPEPPPPIENLIDKFESGGKFGVKDKKGVIIMSPKYDNITQYVPEDKYGMFKVIFNGKGGYISCKGTEYFEN